MTPSDLLEWREHQVLSRPQLAQLLDVHVNTVANWEHGRVPIPYVVELALETLAGNRARLLIKLKQRRVAIAKRREGLRSVRMKDLPGIAAL